MKLVVGLGNPGEKYRKNRHNVGHMVIDKLSPMVNGQDLMIKKTSVFMNNSGEEVKKLVDHYSLAIDHLYVVHDDLDIPLGSYKIQFGKGPKDHQGLASISQALGSNDYWHVRVGIENRNNESGITNYGGVRTPGEEYVLQDFTSEEKVKLEETINKLLIDLIHLISK